MLFVPVSRHAQCFPLSLSQGRRLDVVVLIKRIPEEAIPAYGVIKEHLLQSPLLVFEIRFETIEEHSHIVLQIPLFFHMIFGRFAKSAGLQWSRRLEHQSTPVELEA